MNKCLVLFVEGSTEIEFYKELIKHLRKKHSTGRLVHKIIYRNVKGIGGFKKEVKRIFTKDILAKHKGYSFTVVLCRDTDVFGYIQKPKINWKDIEKELKQDGAEKIIHIKAEKSIEDWFLYDTKNVLRFLKLNSDTKAVGQSGVEKLKGLFKKANKIYTKGAAVKGFVQSLNLDTIVLCIEREMIPLFKELEITYFKKE